MQRHFRCRIVASSMVQGEWAAHEQTVMAELNRHFYSTDRMPWSFTKLVDFSMFPSLPASQPTRTPVWSPAARPGGGDLKNAMHLLATDETKARAPIERRVHSPGRKAADSRMHHHRRVLELCRQSSEKFFAKRRPLFFEYRSYQRWPAPARKCCGRVAAVGLVFTNSLHWAVMNSRIVIAMLQKLVDTFASMRCHQDCSTICRPSHAARRGHLALQLSLGIVGESSHEFGHGTSLRRVAGAECFDTRYAPASAIPGRRRLAPATRGARVFATTARQHPRRMLFPQVARLIGAAPTVRRGSYRTYFAS